MFPSYQIIDMSKHHTAEEIDVINICYGHWASIFSEDLASRGAVLNKGEFHRAKMLAVLTYKQEIVGFHLYSVFNLKEHSSLNHPYMLAIPPEAKDFIETSGVQSVMAMEYLTILPNFRAKKIEDVKPGEIITRLGLMVLEEMQLDIALGVARMDRKVNTMVLDMGFEEVSVVEKFNNKCGVVYWDRRRHRLLGSETVKNFVAGIWQRRNQQSNFDQDQKQAA